MIITIDGPAGSGKSTAARKLAAKLGVAYLDTGAMYRAIALAALQERLLPLADIITPNLPEAERLTGLVVNDLESMRRAGAQIREQAASQRKTAVLVKGGHLPEEAVDLLDDGQTVRHLRAPKLASRNTHGTGCTLSAAIAAALANGAELFEAVQRAKHYVSAAIRQAPDLGHGAGPINHAIPNDQF